jgi:hypothetical protein
MYTYTEAMVSTLVLLLTNNPALLFRCNHFFVLHFPVLFCKKFTTSSSSAEAKSGVGVIAMKQSALYKCKITNAVIGEQQRKSNCSSVSQSVSAAFSVQITEEDEHHTRTRLATRRNVRTVESVRLCSLTRTQKNPQSTKPGKQLSTKCKSLLAQT